MMKWEIQELLSIKEYEKALQVAIAEKKRKPYVADVHYDLAYVYQICGQWMKAYEEYSVARELSVAENAGNAGIEKIDIQKEKILNHIAEELNIGTRKELLFRKRFIDYLVIQDELNWQVRNPVFHNGQEMIGKEYVDYSELPKMFLGIKGLQSAARLIMDKLCKDTITEKAEIQRVNDANKVFEAILEDESFIPLILKDKEVLNFEMENHKADVYYSSPLQYVNYRVPKGHVRIQSQKLPLWVGEIVPIVHSGKRKRLVLSIFADGLSQTMLGKDFERRMPYTYNFFKKGMICENTHTAGDWTFPCVASIVTGQTVAKHKMLHSKLLRKIDIDTPILYEYFKNAGYNTTKIGGNWRVAPNYGYARGMNRVYYHHMYEGYSAERVISDVEEQIYQMRETDQYIWMELGELHLIADEINMAPIQSEFMVWENGTFNESLNSVKQKYDETKRQYYLKQIEYLDRRLAGLFQYIEEHYNEDEIIVSLFADHGQGYFVKPEDEFLSDGRTKVAFMFRGDNLLGCTEEIISTCDYSAILCKLAGVEYNYADTDANLPVAFGGEREREFSVTESIHVGDPYQIILNGKEFYFYLKAKENVTSECLVPLNQYEVKLCDRNGNRINDKVRISYYEKWCLNHIQSCVIAHK